MPLAAGAAAAVAWVPPAATGVVVALYWTCVGLMVLRVRRRARGVSAVLVPSQPLEKILWAIWAPLVAFWIVFPWLFAFSSRARWPFLLAAWPGADTVVFAAAGWVAIPVAVWCLGQSVRCWLHMGQEWRMGVDPAQRGRLIDDGPFAVVRHPIYALSMLLILCSAAAAPAPATSIAAAVHVVLMNLKARNEERFMRGRFGAVYDDYCRRVPRFVPAWRARRSEAEATARDAVLPAGDHPLNSFQRAMLLWEETHPYVAAHAVALAGPLQRDRLRDAIRATQAEYGVGTLAVDRQRPGCSFIPSCDASVSYVLDNNDDDALLERTLSEELNRPFPDEPHQPIRWFVLEHPQRDGHTIGLAYRHLIADGFSIAGLFRRVLQRYATGGVMEPRPPEPPPGTRPPGPPGDDATSNGATIAAVFRAMVMYFRFRFVHKMPDEREMGDETSVRLYAMPPGFVARLRRACRQRRVGLNDAFLAALATAIAQFTPDRHTSRHRRRLALATVLGARPGFARGGSRPVLDVCIGDAVLVVRRPDASVLDVLEEIGTRMRRLKARRDPRRSVSGMQGFFIRNIWPIFDIPNHRRSYRKLLPICGGVSTFVGDGVLTAERGEEDGLPQGNEPDIRRYIRACPCGPATPIVLAPTILGDRLELGMTWRPSCLPPAKAEALLAAVVAALHRVADSATGE